jgi:regulator of nucleoside diphosphate kinase
MASCREGDNMQKQTVTVTDFDSRRLRNVIAGSRATNLRDAVSVDLLEHQLADAEITPAERVDPNVVTINSEVRVSDLESLGTITFRLVFPSDAEAAPGEVSVLAPLGMAVLGRKVGDRVIFQAPGGLRRLRVEHLLYQPEREGIDIG